MNAVQHGENAPSLAEELSLVGVTVAVAVAVSRAFVAWEPLLALSAWAIGAHAVSIGARRLGISAWKASVLAMVVGAIALSAVYYRDLSWFGLPTTDTWAALAIDVRDAFGPFQKLVPPIANLVGFEVVIAGGIWLMATFADLAAHRSDSPVQAVMPHVAAFIFSSVLVLGRGAAIASLVAMAALALFALSVRIRRSIIGGQVARPVWTAGIGLLAGVSVLALVVSPFIQPESGSGLVDLRAIGRDGGNKIVESPLVSLDSLLGGRSNRALFDVTAGSPHYWRLTSLDEFDGRSWSASARYEDLGSGDELDTRWTDDTPVLVETNSFVMRGLESSWLPAGYRPRAVTAPIDLNYDAATNSVLVEDGESTKTIDFQVTSEYLTLGDEELGDIVGESDAAPDTVKDQLELPAGFNPETRRIAEDVAGGRAPAERAVALQNFFRNGRFEYDAAADYRGFRDPLFAFLQNRSGFCQQFATAFAAMARAVGLPSRVAVGFTYGDAGKVVDGTTTWTVRGRHAHAWPEVYLNRLGWVPFEPTPGRGNPDAAGYTGISAQQAESNGTPSATTTTTIASSTSTVPTTTSADDEPRPTVAATSNDDSPGSSTPRFVTVAILVGLAIGLMGAAFRVARVRRRFRALDNTDTPPSDRVAQSWRTTCRDLARVGVEIDPAESPVEFADRAARSVEIEALGTLGLSESNRRFRNVAITPAEADQAVRITRSVRTTVWPRLDRRERASAELDLTPNRR